VPELWTLGDFVFMKLLRFILILLEVLFLLLLVFPPFVESRPLAQAIVAYHDQPSAEHQEEMERQQSHVRTVRFGTSIFTAVLLVANSFGLFYVSRRIRSYDRAVA
jgi:hypothetical protein